VAHAIKERLPDERIIYFGDTAHLPYGDKSAAAVQAYSIKIADLLLQRGCKVIVIACNTASAVATELLKEYVSSRAKVINVIDPMVERVANSNRQGRIGVIGTKGTILSSVYKQKLKKLDKNLHIRELATPLLVPMIEEGFIHNRISGEIIDSYLSNAVLKDISDLILGCTHYPLIKEDIEEYYKGRTAVHDSSVETANYLVDYLSASELINKVRTDEDDHFYVSDYTQEFENSANHFFGERVILEEYKLWE
jgi:glutamate racemase